MRLIAALLSTLLATTAVGQKTNSRALSDSAKVAFNAINHSDTARPVRQQYTPIVNLLEKAVTLDSSNAEAHYFLGYAYARTNATDGEQLPNMDLELVYKTTAHMKKVIALAPTYTGELIVLDPYSKITACWGAMALSYLARQEKDSATWAFEEGKRQGGFSPYVLAHARNMLDACSEKAILASWGDNMTFPVWYVQNVEGYRKDVCVINVSLLSAIWYPRYLVQNKLAAFDLPMEEIDTLTYVHWETQQVKIGDFSWAVSSSLYDNFLLRGDLIFLSLLRANKFRRSIFFTMGFNNVERLSLKDHLVYFIVADKLNATGEARLPYAAYKAALQKALQPTAQLNLNSTNELELLDNIRANGLIRAEELLASGDTLKAKGLFGIINSLADRKYPHQYDEIKEKADRLRQLLQVGKL